MALDKNHLNYLPANEDRSYILDPSATGIDDSGTIRPLDFISDLSVSCKPGDVPYLGSINIGKELISGILMNAAEKDSELTFSPILAFTALKKDWNYGKPIFLDPLASGYSGWITPGRLNLNEAPVIHSYSAPAQSQIAERCLFRLMSKVGKAVSAVDGTSLTGTVSLRGLGGLSLNAYKNQVFFTLDDRNKQLCANGVNFFSQYQTQPTQAVGCIGGACPDDQGNLAVVFNGPFTLAAITDEEGNTVGANIGVDVSLEDLCDVGDTSQDIGIPDIGLYCEALPPYEPECVDFETMEVSSGTAGSGGSSLACIPKITLSDCNDQVISAAARCVQLAVADVSRWCSGENDIEIMVSFQLPDLECLRQATAGQGLYISWGNGTVTPFAVDELLPQGNVFTKTFSHSFVQIPGQATRYVIRVQNRCTHASYASVAVDVVVSEHNLHTHIPNGLGEVVVPVYVASPGTSLAYLSLFGCQGHYDKVLGYKATPFSVMSRGSGYEIRPGTAEVGSCTPDGSDFSSVGCLVNSRDGCVFDMSTLRERRLRNMFPLANPNPWTVDPATGAMMLNVQNQAVYNIGTEFTFSSTGSNRAFCEQEWRRISFIVAWSFMVIQCGTDLAPLYNFLLLHPEPVTTITNYT